MIHSVSDGGGKTASEATWIEKEPEPAKQMPYRRNDPELSSLWAIFAPNSISTSLCENHH
jgi:hypothetical protein